MASVASQLIEEVTAHAQNDSLEDVREICTDSTYFPNNLCTNESLGSIKAHNFLTTWATIRFSISTALHRLNQSICQSVSQVLMYIYQMPFCVSYLSGGSFNIILWTFSRFLKWSLPFRLADWNSVGNYNFSHAYYRHCPSKPLLFDHPNDLWAVQA